MSTRKPIKVSGLIQRGVIVPAQNDSDPFAYTQYNDTTAATAQTSGRRRIRLDLVDDSPYQPRTLYDSSELDLLANSLVAAGQEEPIKVREKNGGRYEIAGSGHRRVRAARSLGWVEIDADVVIRTDREAKLATMVSNESRIDLTDFERAKLYQEAMTDGFAKTQAEIANLFGTSQGHVSKRIAMLKLPDVYLLMLEKNPNLFAATCSESIIQLLKQYPNEATLIESAVLRIAEEGADQKSVIPWVQQMVKQHSRTTASNKPKVVTSKTGRQMFTAKLDGRVITVRISAQDVDGNATLTKLLESLRDFADTEQNKQENP